jgi:hypothetical protein
VDRTALDQDVGDLGAPQQDVVQGDLDRVRVDAEGVGERRLRVEVDRQHLLALVGQGDRQ